MSKATYQMKIPVFIVSVLMGIYLVEQFTKMTALTNVKKQLDLWGTIILATVFLFGYTFSVIGRVRSLNKARHNPFNKTTFASVVVLVVFAIFVLVILTQGISSRMYSLLYQYLPGYVTPTGFHGYYDLYLLYRLFRFSDIYVILYFGVVIFRFLTDISVVSYYFPILYDMRQWIEYVPHNAAYQATLFAGGVGLIILGVRALVGREPGLIELEKV